jgi:hypothetical protein
MALYGFGGLIGLFKFWQLVVRIENNTLHLLYRHYDISSLLNGLEDGVRLAAQRLSGNTNY